MLKFIEWYVGEIVGAMGRKICLNKGKLGYRRSINISERIHRHLMLDFFKAVRDYHHVRIGVRARRDDLKKAREDGSVLRELKIVFTDENSAFFHLGKGSGLLWESGLLRGKSVSRGSSSYDISAKCLRCCHLI